MLGPLTIQLTDAAGNVVAGLIDVRSRDDETFTVYHDEKGTVPVTLPAASSPAGLFVGWVETGPYEWMATHGSDVTDWQPVNVSSEGEPGPQGPAGPAGPAGPPGIGTDFLYVHVQMVAVDFWQVDHGLGAHPNVTVVDSTDRVVVADINYVDDNSLDVTLSSAMSGKAYLS